MNSTLSATLKAAIQAELRRGVSLRELARRAEIPAPCLSRFMAGARDLSLETAERLAGALGLALGEQT